MHLLPLDSDLTLVTSHSERHRGYGSRSLVPGSFLRTLATTLRHGILKTRGTFIPKFLVLVLADWPAGILCVRVSQWESLLQLWECYITLLWTFNGNYASPNTDCQAECPVTKWRLFSKCESVVWVTKSKSTRSTLGDSAWNSQGESIFLLFSLTSSHHKPWVARSKGNHDVDRAADVSLVLTVSCK